MGTFAVVYSHLGFTISASSFEPANTQNSIDDAMPISFFDTIRVSNDGDVAIDVAPIRPSTNVDKGSAHGLFVVKMRNATTLNELPFDETVLGGITIAYNADSRALRVAGSGAESVTLTAEIPTSKYIDPAEASKYAFMNVHIDAFPKNDDWSGALASCPRSSRRAVPRRRTTAEQEQTLQNEGTCGERVEQAEVAGQQQLAMSAPRYRRRWALS